MNRTCGKCNKEIRDIEPAQCGFCNMFFHIKPECSDITRSHMQQLFNCGKALWICPHCRTSADNFQNISLNDVTRSQSALVTDLRSQIKSLTDLILSLQTKISEYNAQLLSKINDLNSKIGDLDSKNKLGSDSSEGNVNNTSHHPKNYSHIAKQHNGTDNESRNQIIIQPPVTCGTNDFGFTDLSVPCFTVEPPAKKFWLYLTGFHPSVLEEDITKIINRCLDTTEPPVIIRLTPKGKDVSSYSFVSFKVGLNMCHKETALLASTWPRNVKFREFTSTSSKN